MLDTTRPPTPVTRDSYRALTLFAYCGIAFAVLAGLYWAQPVLIPVALGLLLTTIAAPIIKLLQQRFGFSRIPAVATLSTLVMTVGLGIGWLIYSQATQLVAELPTYEDNIVAKIDSLQAMSRTPWREKWERLIQRVTRAIQTVPTPELPTPGNSAVVTATATEPIAPATGASGVTAQGTTAIEHALQITGYFAFAAVLALFLLIDHGDFRNRIVQLVGRNQLTQTTKALDDAGKRISRFLLMQALINTTFGVVLTICLYLLHINYALLWGVLAVLLRYIPYVGGMMATTFPTLLALAQFTSWWPAIIIIGIVVIQEFIVNNFVEPKLFGNSIGVSPVALIIAAAFWTFLWGPVGLIIAGPLTVCLVVLGQYVPALRFLGALLGSEWSLQKEMVLYQRLLAKDEIETERIIEESLEEYGVTQTYDELIFPAAVGAGFDRQNELLSVEDEEHIYDELDATISENVEASQPNLEESKRPRVRILLVAARDRGDQLALNAIEHTLDRQRYELIIAAPGLMRTEIVALAKEEEVHAVCIVSLPPGGLSPTKYLCRQLRAALPKLKLLVAHMQNREDQREGWKTVSADGISFSLQDLLRQFEAWRPVLETPARQAAQDAPETPGEIETPATVQLQLGT